MKRGMNGNTPEPSQFTEISTLIEQATGAVVSQANYALTLLFWNIGKRVHEVMGGLRETNCRATGTTIKLVSFFDALAAKNHRGKAVLRPRQPLLGF